MAEYIERGVAKEAVKYIPWCDWKAVGDCLDELPAADVVSLPVVRQIQWERDIAMQQLEEHGIPFCGKADVVAVVRCKDCKRRYTEDCVMQYTYYSDGYSEDGVSVEWTADDDFCSYGERRADR